jgi:PKD repeat protein
MEDYTVSIGSYDGVFQGAFITGLSPEWGPLDYDPTIGWNTHDFTTPFLWDGVSDLIIETCFSDIDAGGGGGGGGGTDNHETRMSETGDILSSYSDHNNNDSACDDEVMENLATERPNMQLVWTSLEVPPVAVIEDISISDCSGLLTVQEASFYQVDTWLWYFGDGATSNEQTPTHIYSTEGMYDISLVVTNTWGTDSITVASAVNVVLPGTIPATASCYPSTQDMSAGFGPVELSLAGVVNATENGSIGFDDQTCTLINLTEGENYDLSVTCDGQADNHVAAWIDYNADGIFTADELIMSEVTSGTATTSFTVSTSAIMDSTLRMRVMSDFYLLGQPESCTDLQGGQAEDYSVIITANTSPPAALFDSDLTYTCDGTVQFTDLSENVPDGWFWEFGDSQVSTQADPTHTYTESGVYSVTLTVQNAFGADTVTISDFITVDLSAQLVAAACEPSTGGYCCGYGIHSFDFMTISNPTADGADGYQDYSCEFEAEVTEGIANMVTIDTGTENPQDVVIFVDFNNDGAFTAAEEVFFSGNTTTHSGDITIPVGTAVLEERLRMRVIGDFVGNGNNGCNAPQFGQIEDYALVVYPDTMPPAADFSASPLFSCDGEIQFNNLSSGATGGYTWHFGDTSTSTEESPAHIYTSEGVFTVSLVASNDFGSDSIAFTDYITVDFNAICDTLSIPEDGFAFSGIQCNGILTDDGGPDADYSNNSTGAFTIEVDLDEVVVLNFLEFQFQNNDDLIIYDGPDVFSPVIGVFNGGDLPNGGTIISTGSAVTLQQNTNPFGNQSGFVLEWECEPLGIDENGLNNGLSIYPNPADEQLFIRLSAADLQLKEIVISDMTGRIVHHDASPNYLGAVFNLDLSALDAGTYFIEARTNKGRSASQIVISK